MVKSIDDDEPVVAKIYIDHDINSAESLKPKILLNPIIANDTLNISIFNISSDSISSILIVSPSSNYYQELTEISNNISVDLSTLDNGTYLVILNILNDSIPLFSEFSIQHTNKTAEYNPKEIFLSPNPVSSNLSVSLNEVGVSEISTISLISMDNGTSINIPIPQTSQFNIDVSSLSNGIWFIVLVLNDDERPVINLIKINHE